jgi:hypothetical protein
MVSGLDNERLPPSQAVALARSIEAEVRAEAKRRQGHGSTAPGRHKENAGQHLSARDAIAARCGYSAKTLRKIMLVVDEAARAPDQLGGVLRRMDESGNVEAAYRVALNCETDRLFAAPKILMRTEIGRMRLCQFPIAEIRWLIGFFSALQERLSAPWSDEMSIVEFLTVAQVKRASAYAYRMCSKQSPGVKRRQKRAHKRNRGAPRVRCGTP